MGKVPILLIQFKGVRSSGEKGWGGEERSGANVEPFGAFSEFQHIKHFSPKTPEPRLQSLMMEKTWPVIYGWR